MEEFKLRHIGPLLAECSKSNTKDGKDGKDGKDDGCSLDIETDLC